VEEASSAAATSSRSVVPHTQRSTSGVGVGHGDHVARIPSARIGTAGSCHVAHDYDRSPCR